MLTLLGIWLHSPLAFKSEQATATHVLVEESTRSVKNQRYAARFFMQSFKSRYCLQFSKVGGSSYQLQVPNLLALRTLLPELCAYSGFIPVLVQATPLLLLRAGVLQRFLENAELPAGLHATRCQLLAVLVIAPQYVVRQVKYGPVSMLIL